MAGGDSLITSRIDGVMTSVAVKAPVACVATSAVALTGTPTIDGVVLSETIPPTRVLLTAQTDPTANGIYDVLTSGWLRSVDFDGQFDAVLGTILMVTGGTSYGGSTWKLTTPNPVIFETSDLTFELIFTPITGLIGGDVVFFATTAQLLAGIPAPVVVPDGQIFETAGRTAKGIGGGRFYYDASDTTTADNLGTVRVDGQGRRFKLLNNRMFDPTIFGVVGDGVTDDTTAYQACITVAFALANTGLNSTQKGNVPSLPVVIDHAGLNILISSFISIPYGSVVKLQNGRVTASGAFSTSHSLFENLTTPTTASQQTNTGCAFENFVFDASHRGGCVFFSGTASQLFESCWFLHYGSSGATRAIGLYIDNSPVFSGGTEIRNCRFDEYVHGETNWNVTGAHYGTAVMLTCTDTNVHDCYAGYGKQGFVNDGQFNRMMSLHDYTDLGSINTANGTHAVWDNLYIDNGLAPSSSTCLTIVNPDNCSIRGFMGLAVGAGTGYSYIVIQASGLNNSINGLIIKDGFFVSLTPTADINAVKTLVDGSNTFNTAVTNSYIGDNSYAAAGGTGAIIKAFTEVKTSIDQSSASAFVFSLQSVLPIGAVQYVHLASDCGGNTAAAPFMGYGVGAGGDGRNTVVTVNAKAVTYSGSTPTVANFSGNVYLTAGVNTDTDS